MKAKACPHCGSDENTGWSENTYLDGIGMYDEEDYRETLRKELGMQSTDYQKRKNVLVIVSCIVVFVFLVYVMWRL